MAKPRKPTPPPGWKDPLAPQQPLASGRWILGAAMATILLAAVCVYITFCLLFWQGQWQLVFQPSHVLTSTPASAGLAYDDIRFDATETGILQLDGWWIPADQPSRYTLLFLHGSSGSLSSSLAQLQALHKLGLNIFAFDYRGFGKSVNIHPSEKSTYADADAAWAYLTGTRHLAPSTIVLYGSGIGAVIAAEAAGRHPEAPAVILEDPPPPTLDALKFNPQTRLLPVHLLFHDRFDPTGTLAHLRTPKLFLYPPQDPASRYFEQAAEPKQKANSVPGANIGSDHYLATLRSFLGKYLPAS